MVVIFSCWCWWLCNVSVLLFVLMIVGARASHLWWSDLWQPLMSVQLVVVGTGAGDCGLSQCQRFQCGLSVSGFHCGLSLCQCQGFSVDCHCVSVRGFSVDCHCVSVRVSVWTVTVSVSGFQCGLSLCQCQGFQCGMSLCQCQGFQSGLSLYQCQEFHCGLLGVSLYFLHCSPLHILFQVQTSLQRAAPVWSNSQWIRYVWVCLLTSPDSVVSGKVVVLWRSRVLLHNMIEGVKMESHVLLQSIYDQL